MERCVVLGCTTSVSKGGHKLCLPHWKAQKDGGVRECERCSGTYEASVGACPACAPAGKREATRHAEDEWLSSTKIGEQLGLPARRVNLVLAELGWIEKQNEGWTPTEQGLSRGAQRREARQTGVPYAVWRRAVIENRILLDAMKDPSSASPAADAGPAVTADPGMEFRAKFPATFRTQDGHLVRSRAEVMIDDWLYTQRITHAYERRVPIEENVYCDFWLPRDRVYIEYWGMENDSKYAERKARKLAAYKKHNLQLVELTDEDIKNVDEALARKLGKFEIKCD